MRQFPSPETGRDLAEFPFGVDLQNDYYQIIDGRCEVANNMDYKQRKLRRRNPFTAYSTETWPADISRIHEYKDPDGTDRLLFASMDGKVKEYVSSTSHVDRVTGLTSNQRGWFEGFIGAAYHQNGTDSPRRGDGTTWRVAGAPPVTTASDDTTSAGVLTGDYKWIVTACIRESGTVILESDWSNLVEVTLASQQQKIDWVSSSDARVNWYRLYRTKAAGGGVFFLVTEGNITTYTDNTADIDLSAQQPPPLAYNGEMPISKYMAVAGQRLCLGNLTDANDDNSSKAVHVSRVARNTYEAEYFPVDGIHKFYLPGGGPLTAIASFSVKDEEQNNRDLFLAQENSCYILRNADPNGKLETVSTYVGVVNAGAHATWDRHLFFVSRRGLEFFGPQGTPILISQHVEPFFKGGGNNDYSIPPADDGTFLQITDNNLICTIRGSSAEDWGTRALVLDLEGFDPLNPRNTAVFTTYQTDGLGMAFGEELSDGTFILIDNTNNRVLQRGTGGQDYIDGTDTNIKGVVATNALMRGMISMLKRLRWVNVVQLSQDDVLLDVNFDRGTRTDLGIVLPASVTLSEWSGALGSLWSGTLGDEWASSLFGIGGKPVKRNVKGRALKITLTHEKNTPEWVFIGLQCFYTQISQKRVGNR